MTTATNTHAEWTEAERLLLRASQRAADAARAIADRLIDTCAGMRSADPDNLLKMSEALAHAATSAERLYAATITRWR